MRNFYRSDIDALRGYSIIFVILYHARFYYNEFFLFSGGFIGVDIFFVITGFLITKLLVSEYNLNSSIDILDFFERRIRRLIPVLFLVLLISTLFSLLVLEPTKLKLFSESFFASIFFVANIYFHYFGNFYATDASLKTPLLHLWSLGIEEQFYILYPFLLLIGLKFFKRFIIFFALAGILISLSFAEYASTHHTMFNFYMLPSRVWEIGVGALVALLSLRKKIILNNFITNSIIFLSFITLSFFLFFFSTGNKHPSLITLIPVCITSILIYLGEIDTKTAFKNFFYNKYIIFFGKISFSLYLWHFLIFSIFRNFYIDENILIKLIIIILSIILSFFSYKLVEQKFRNRSISFKKVIKFLIILFIPTLILNIAILKDKNFIKSFYSIDGVNLTEWNDTEWAIRQIRKHSSNDNFPGNKKRNILVVGNCHGHDIYLIFKLNNQNYKDYNFELANGEVGNFINFMNNSNLLYKEASTIIFATKWNDRVEDVNALDKIIKKGKEDNKELIIFGPNPEFDYKEEKLMYTKNYFTNYKKYIKKKNSTNLSNEEIKNLKNIYFNQLAINQNILNIEENLQSISKKNKVKFISLIKLICNQELKICEFLAENSNEEIFRDYGRFSKEGYSLLNKKFQEINVLKN